ncbi:oligosaccharide flippase family protein [Lichenicoccus sp.]|uniref:oligosaccharide flippase family protein n=1 Tax=Lichenicoccus sp. TaxID=2781899 RepID=UPI003D12100B
MDSHQRDLARGFNWLGGATIIAKIVDFATVLAVLGFLTKQQVGVGSLVVSIGMVIESLDGLGTSEALVQARAVSRLQLDTLFWFVVGAAAVVAGLTMLVAPGIEAIYGAAGITTYFLAIAVKQPLVGAALIPLAIMNRDLQYERIAVVHLCATLAAASTRLGLAVWGAGAWALVGGYSASGLYILVGACLASPFLPRPRFEMRAIRPLLRFGWRAASSNIFEQVFKNVDYLLVGWFYGASQLAVYRVAFDVAMEPAMAVGTLVNRTALPVLARVSGVPELLAQSLQWSWQRIAILVAPLMVGLILVAGPLTSLLHDNHGNSYAAAALPLKILATAALLRIASQVLYPVLMGSGRPGTAARLSATTLLLLSVGILAAGFSVSARHGLVAVSAVWLGVYPLVLAWGMCYLRRHWHIQARDLIRPFIAPLIGVAAMVSGVEATGLLIVAHEPATRIGIVLVATMMTYAGLFLHARLRSHHAA